MKVPQTPWVSRKKMPVEDAMSAFLTCTRGSKGFCIISNWSRYSAKPLGRIVRKLSTYKGWTHWSEYIDGEWLMFKAPLLYKVAKRADAFDNPKTRTLFKPPAKAHGPAEYVGVCVERHDPPEVILERKMRMEERVKAGTLVRRAKFREPQAQYVMV